MSESRIDLARTTPSVYRAMMSLAQEVGAQAESVGLEPELMELIKLRASQLNGCAFCLDMHSTDARKLGMTDQRLDLLAAWRETDLYSARERAALALTEAITFVSEGHVPDQAWQEAGEVFTEHELATAVWAAATINTWNRLAISARRPVPSR
jgi:AhpD family alkylhydroperoxidase